MTYHLQVKLTLYYIITTDHSSLLSFQKLHSYIRSYRWLKAVVCSHAVMLRAARYCLFGRSLRNVEASKNICTFLQKLTIWPQEKVILKNLLLYKNVNICISEAHSLSYHTAQTTYFSLTSTLPQVLLQGCQVSWLQAGTECRSFSTAM